MKRKGKYNDILIILNSERDQHMSIEDVAAAKHHKERLKRICNFI